jgi:hypothetical protein
MKLIYLILIIFNLFFDSFCADEGQPTRKNYSSKVTNYSTPYSRPQTFSRQQSNYESKKSTETSSKKEKKLSDEKSEKEKPQFIYDNYTEKRGAPKMLQIFCKSCRRHIMDYQKDGPGRLLRCYLDRIHYPDSLYELQFKKFDVKKFPYLRCKCLKVIGHPMVYFSENRPAYRMVADNFYFCEID